MYNYYCKNCNNIIGVLRDYYKYFYINDVLDNCCSYTQSKNIDTIYFLDCKKCNKFVGILINNVCENCFGENLIFDEKNLFNFFFKYKKIVKKYSNSCKTCNKNYFRWQVWFFEELTFYK